MNSKSVVLIVGAGPTGLMAALELARFGLAVRIIDKLPQAATTSRALAIQARTLELFEQRGLVDEMLRLGQRCFTTKFFSNGAQIGSVELNRIPSRYNYILMLPQSETERILTEALAKFGVSVERPIEMVAFSQNETGVQATLRKADGAIELVDAAYLISAEGAHSLARRTLGLNFAGVTIEQHYALADVHVDADVSEDALSIFLADHLQFGSFLGLFPMGHKRFRLIASEPPNDGKVAPKLEDLEEMFRAATARPARLYDLSWSSHFRINSRMIDRLRVGRVFFGGDSAHIHSPAGGQGMNTGLQDMINLCWKLAYVELGIARPELLRTYDEERIPVIRNVVTRTERMTDALNSRNPFVHKLFRSVLPHVLGQDFIQNFATKMIGEVATNYRASSFSCNRYPLASLQAGDRLPDQEQPDGTRLYSRLDPTKLVLFSRSPIPADIRARVGSFKVTETPAFPHPGFEFVLIRPDGYIGYLGESLSSWESFRSWLDLWFTKAASNQ